MSAFRRIYLDNSATTRVDHRAVEAMLPFLTKHYGNASSVHFFGQEARAAVDLSRGQVAALVGAQTNEIVFVSGGSEANNLAIRGVAEAEVAHGRHLITSAIEHPSVQGACDRLEENGWQITRLPVYENGIVRIADLRDALRPDTVLVSVMLANNEIGTIQPVAEIGALVRAERSGGHRHLWFHTDAIQAAGRIPINVEALGCDLLSLSAHKIHAPKGVGALFVRRQTVGGHQERERRAGTEPVAAIVAFAAAAEFARLEIDDRYEHLRHLRDKFEAGVLERIDAIEFNGDRTRRLPHLSNISFRSIEGEGLLISLDLQGIAVSTGSACSSGSLEPSPVILALGRDGDAARGAVRFSFGKDNTEDDVDYTLEVLSRAVQALRRLSPLHREGARIGVP
jgi:cysteine desulfurase